MKRLLYILPLAFILLSACHRDEVPQATDYGYLSLNLSLTITSEPANGRTLAVNTDDFRVTIFAADGTEVMVFDPFSSAPAEVSLPTGEYYVEAHSNNLVDAAFENPYYFGRFDNFTIDKEELKSIDIEAELANTKVAINYSANVVNTFHSHTGTVTVVNSGASLFYAQGETREGYFLTSPLDVEVNLSYTKLDGTTIDRTFTASIADPQPKTLYNINVDATLADGKIVFNIIVDEGFDTVDIYLGDAADIVPFEENGFFVDDVFYPTPIAVFACGPLAGFNDCQFLLSNGAADLCSGTQFVSIAGIASIGATTEITPGEYLFSTQNSAPSNEPELANTFIWSLAITDIPGFTPECELVDGYNIWDTDQNGTDEGWLLVNREGDIYTLIFQFQFTGGPEVRGSFVGELTDLNS
jgi:hypothetical protein